MHEGGLHCTYITHPTSATVIAGPALSYDVDKAGYNHADYHTSKSFDIVYEVIWL
jgi:hypothetical protein